MKNFKKFMVLVLSVMMTLSTITPLLAATTTFPLTTYINGLGSVVVADEGTKFITLITQDPDTKIITAQVLIRNTGVSTINMINVGFALSFTNDVAPINHNGEL